MSELVKTFYFNSNGESFAFTSGGKATGSWQSAGGNTGGCWNINSLGRNNSDTSYIELTTTWENLGITEGATINAINASAFDWMCNIANVSNGYTVGALEILDNSGVLQATLISGLAGSGVTGFANRSNGSQVSVPSAIQVSDTIIKIRLSITLNNGNNAAAETGILIDNLSLGIDYTAAGQSLTQTVNDSVSLTDSRISSVEKALSDTVALSDEQTKAADYDKSISDEISLSDQPQGAAVFDRGQDDSVSLSDNHDSAFYISFEYNDEVTLSDHSTKDFGKNVSDEIALQDDHDTESEFYREEDDSIALSDETGSEKIINKEVSDSIVLSDESSVSRVIFVEFSDSIVLSDYSGITWSRDLVSRISQFATRVGQEIKSVIDSDKYITDATFNDVDQELVISRSAGLSDLVIPMVGMQGPQGYQGNQGEPGAQGDQGTQGLKGDQGDTGHQGEQGLKGDQGEQGVQGVPGEQGHQGHQGVTGNKGDQGDPGVKGAQGDQGTQGHQGLTGEQGEPGPQGEQGDTGMQGDQGYQGDQGHQGYQGVSGDPPSDNSITYAKVGTDLKSRATDNDGAWDFSANGVIDSAISSNTTVSFSNLQQNKTLKVKVVISNSSIIALPSYCTVLDGSAEASGNNGIYYFYFDCWDDANGSEEILVSITQAAS